MIPCSDERLNNINKVGLALSEGGERDFVGGVDEEEQEGWGLGWVVGGGREGGLSSLP